MLPPTFAWTLHLLSGWYLEIKTPRNPPTEFNERDHVFKCFPLTSERLVATYLKWSSSSVCAKKWCCLKMSHLLQCNKWSSSLKNPLALSLTFALQHVKNPSYPNDKWFSCQKHLMFSQTVWHTPGFLTHFSVVLEILTCFSSALKPSYHLQQSGPESLTVRGPRGGHLKSPSGYPKTSMDIPLKIDMEHNHGRFGRLFLSFLNRWFGTVGSKLTFQGVPKNSHIWT